MDTDKEQSPRQDLPNGGTALPSASTNHQGEAATADSPTDSMPTRRTGQSRSSGPVAEAQRAETQLAEFKDAVRDKVENPQVGLDELLVVLRSHPLVAPLRLKDEDIERYIQVERTRRTGRVREIARGMKLDTRPIKWIWEGILGADGSNLVFGDPKTGKTRFILGFLDAYLNGAETYLGQKLPKQRNEVYIVGPDMTESSWSSFLKDFHLGDSSGAFHQKIRGIVAQGHDFKLDATGIEQIRQHAEESPGLIVLLDSLTTVMAGLGLDENRPNYVDPITELKDQLAPYRCTLVIIHHSKKEAGAGSMATDARGSSAVSGAVDQLVKLRQFSTGSYISSPSEIQVCTSGRFAGVQNLVVDWDEDSACWVNRGNTEDRYREVKALEVGDKLSDHQAAVVRTVVKVWNDEQRGVGAMEIRKMEALFANHPPAAMYGFLKALVESKGFLEQCGVVGEGKGKGAKLYKPTDRALAWVIKRSA